MVWLYNIKPIKMSLVKNSFWHKWYLTRKYFIEQAIIFFFTIAYSILNTKTFHEIDLGYQMANSVCLIRHDNSIMWSSMFYHYIDELKTPLFISHYT